MSRSTALMAAAALLLLLLSSTALIAYGEERSEEEVETRRMFRDWMAKTKKTYNSIDEEEHRYAVFKENLRRYGDHSGATDAAGVPIPLGLNGFGDLTDEELGSWNTGCSRTEPDLLHKYVNYALQLQWRNIFRWVFPGGRDRAV